MAEGQTIKHTACRIYWDMDLLRKHLDLFSGIGGFALAARWAGIETIGFCEIDKYAQKVLEKNFPGIPIYEDVTKLNGSEFKDIFLITGGFPCQDISIAGKGAGIEGERSGLWSELFRIIGEVGPKYALIENVPALTFRGGTRVIGDLAEIGYDTEWQIVGADDVGAPHRRKRIWIVAYPKHSTDRTKGGEERKEESIQGINRETGLPRLSGGTDSNTGDVAYSKSKGTWENNRRLWEGISRTGRRERASEDVAYSNSKREIGNKSEYREGCGFESRSEDVAYSKSKRVEGCRTGGEQESHTHGQEGLPLCEGERSRAANWLPEPSVGRVVNGLPHRVDRLKGLGNAIVPQVAYEIMKLLK